jgi:ElaB/YqjD/DUF883 family membrane-anchored ribosome-binding protein
MEATQRMEGQNVIEELETAVQEGEASLRDLSGDKTGELRARLQAAVDKAKAVCDRLQEKTVAAAKATDRTVREHPYQSIGIAFGVGMLIGILAMRSRQGGD